MSSRQPGRRAALAGGGEPAREVGGLWPLHKRAGGGGLPVPARALRGTHPPHHRPRPALLILLIHHIARHVKRHDRTVPDMKEVHDHSSPPRSASHSAPDPYLSPPRSASHSTPDPYLSPPRSASHSALALSQKAGVSPVALYRRGAPLSSVSRRVGSGQSIDVEVAAALGSYVGKLQGLGRKEF
jgi:hypothetical protein